MRAPPKNLLVGAALAFAAAALGCRAVDGLGGLVFGPSTGGGGGAGGAGSTGGAPGAGGAAGAGGAGGAPTCAPAGDVCASAPPPGWTGPVALYEGGPGTVPACSGPYSVILAQGHMGLDAAPATCTTCTCSAPAVSCGSSALTVYSKQGCHGTGGDAQMLASAACTPIEYMSSSTYWCGQTSPAPTMSGCTPSTSSATVPPATWTTAGVVCGLAGGAVMCGGAGACAPPPATPFAPTWCIFQKGAQTCPAGFPRQHVWEDVTSDARGCTPCTCGAASGATCATTTALYGDAQCQSQISTLKSDSDCSAVTNAQAAIATVTLSGEPSCPAGGGAPTGSATTMPVATICCPE